MVTFFCTIALALFVAWLPHAISVYNREGKSFRNLTLVGICWVISREPIARMIINHYRKKMPDFTITDENGQPYLTRWWLFNPYDNYSKKRKFPWLPVNIRIHRFNSPDKDEHLHDHPWDAVSLIFSGSYLELRPTDKYYKGTRIKNMRIFEAGEINCIKATDFHTIERLWGNEKTDENCVWTVFITFRKTKSWGFLMDDDTVKPWRDYLGIK